MYEFKAIILQPISKAKDTWAKYDENQNDFLTFFQETFKNEIKQKFHVNHKTESFSNFLLIPYFLDKKQRKCFAIYHIKYGEEIRDNEYSWSYIIDYKKSHNFKEEVLKYDLVSEIEFNNDTFEEVRTNDRVSYYKSSILSDNSKAYISSLCKNETIA